MRGDEATGKPEPVTVGPGWNRQAAVSRDGLRIALAIEDVSFTPEILPFDAEAGRVLGEPRPVMKQKQRSYFLNLSPDGRSLVFDSHRGSRNDLWRVDLGGDPVQLTLDPTYDDTFPRWSPDGRRIAFGRSAVQRLPKTGGIWLMEPDGANPRLAVEHTSGFFDWMPSGEAVVYRSAVDGQCYVTDLSSGKSRKLTDETQIMPVLAVSPDGRWLVYQSTRSGRVDLRAVALEGGPSRAVVSTSRQNYHPSFSPSGRWLYFGPDHKNLYRVPGPTQGWRAAEPEKVTNFAESGLSLEDPQISRDGMHLLYSRGYMTGDIWLVNLGQREGER